MYKIGINTNNECGQNDFEILENIKAVGFDNIMISFKSSNIEKSIEKAKELGLNIEYFHLESHLSDYLWTKGEMALKAVNKLISEVELCAKNNISIAILHPTYGSPSSQCFKPNMEGIKNVNKILNVAKKHNIKIALENLDKNNHKHLQYLLRHIKDESLGFCYDVGHHHLYNENKDLIKIFGKRLFALHLHDNLIDWKYGYDHSRDLHLLPFDGKINFEKICNKLQEVNYTGIIMLEIHKVSFPTPLQYEKVNNIEFLQEAKNRANKLVDLLIKKQ